MDSWAVVPCERRCPASSDAGCQSKTARGSRGPRRSRQVFRSVRFRPPEKAAHCRQVGWIVQLQFFSCSNPWRPHDRRRPRRLPTAKYSGCFWEPPWRSIAFAHALRSSEKRSARAIWDGRVALVSSFGSGPRIWGLTHPVRPQSPTRRPILRLCCYVLFVIRTLGSIPVQS
jgi:hypothetical protein